MTIRGDSPANLVQNNDIGTDVNAAVAVANGGNGIQVIGSDSTTIGGAAANQGNIISGNGGDGIVLRAAQATDIEGNFIGTDATGRFRIANQVNGVELNGAAGNFIGGRMAPGGLGNDISGNSGAGILITDAGSAFNTVVGNFIGTDLTVTLSLANLQDGVKIDGAPNNNIGFGGATKNVISANDGNGVFITGAGAIRNTVQNNVIGTDQMGVQALGNLGRGVLIQDASFTLVGSRLLNPANVISGNHADGVAILGANAQNNAVYDNFIGVDVNGAKALPNLANGILIQDAQHNFIGDPAAAARNVISGNGQAGVAITGAASKNTVDANDIGTDPTGAFGLGNTADGVLIQDATANTIGGLAAGSGNVISANGGNGLSITGAASDNEADDNEIGTDISGTAPLGNAGNGVSIQDADHNSIGSAGVLNVISANALNGVFIGGVATENLVAGAFIGTDMNSLAALPNGRNGVLIEGAPENKIQDDTISANPLDGVLIDGVGASENSVEGGLIGTDVNGMTAIPNGLDGVAIQDASDGQRRQLGRHLGKRGQRRPPSRATRGAPRSWITISASITTATAPWATAATASSSRRRQTRSARATSSRPTAATAWTSPSFRRWPTAT